MTRARWLPGRPRPAAPGLLREEAEMAEVERPRVPRGPVARERRRRRDDLPAAEEDVVGRAQPGSGGVQARRLERLVIPVTRGPAPPQRPATRGLVRSGGGAR